MNTLTQVWFFFLGMCSVLLVLGFKIAGRWGLLSSFFISILLIYLFLDKGLKRSILKLNAIPLTGNDPSGLKTQIQKIEGLYKLHKTEIFITPKNTPPLVWRNLNAQVQIVLSSQLLAHLTPDEIKMLAHLLLSHGKNHHRFQRRLYSTIYYALRPFSHFLNIIFNFLGVLSRFNKQIYTSDIESLQKMDNVDLKTKYDFLLLLKKLHHFNFHQSTVKSGELFFSLLSPHPKISFYNLNLAPQLRYRMLNLSGDI